MSDSAEDLSGGFEKLELNHLERPKISSQDVQSFSTAVGYSSFQQERESQLLSKRPDLANSEERSENQFDVAGQEELVILPGLAQDVVEEQLDAVESAAFASQLESDASLPADAEAL